MPYHILLTIDVEDWFQVENLKRAIPFESWPTRELRVERNTHRILDLLDEASLKRSAISDQLFAQERIRQDQQEVSSGSNTLSQFRQETEEKSGRSCLPRVSAATAGKSCLKGFVDNGDGHQTTGNGQDGKVRGTFFVLGWLAERLPNLVREIHARGHEVASHGYGHELCSRSSSADLREELTKSKKLLEDIAGARVYGYRAPSFSISDDILEWIAEAGYLYDSSYNSFAMHGLYGKISLNGSGRKGIAYKISDGFYELPISNLILKKPLNSQPFDAAQGAKLSALSSEQSRSRFVLPWGGGAYFRLVPSSVFHFGVKRILKEQDAYLFYIHPWEVDPEQPRPEGITVFSRFKHYTNLDKTHRRLDRFIKTFSDCRFVTCSQYLELK